MARIVHVFQIVSLLTSVIILSLLVVAPKSAHACQQWKVPEVFVARQDNRTEVSFQLRQNGSSLTGFARYATTKRTVIGNLSASIIGNRFSAKVLWTYSGVSSIGNYSGVIDPSGYLHGTTYDSMSAKPVSAGWDSAQFMHCDLGPVEPLVDRPGGDYRNFDLSKASYELCRTACESDQRCKAYTYVKPGVQGPSARCWLKTDVLAQRQSDCCVSGVIRFSQVLLPRKPDDIVRGLPRGAQR